MIDYDTSDRRAVSYRRQDILFCSGQLNVKRNDHVIVETARGIEYGTVVGEPKEEQDDKVVQPLKSVLRIATPKDDEQEAANKLKEKRSL